MAFLFIEGKLVVVFCSLVVGGTDCPVGDSTEVLKGKLPKARPACGYGQVETLSGM